MARMFTRLVIAVALLGISASLAHATIVPDLLYQEMEEAWNGNPNEVIDSSPSGHHGMAYGGADTVDSGLVMLGRSGSFDGSNDYVDVGNASSLNPAGAITIEGWIKPASISGWSASGEVVGRNTAYYLQVDPNSTVSSYFYYDNGSGVRAGGGWLNASVPNLSDKWTHVAATSDGQNEYLYVDGVEMASRSRGSDLDLWQATAATNTGKLGGSTRYFKGLLDEVGIHGSALTQQEIRQQARQPDLLELRMDELSWDPNVADVIDSSGMDHHGKAVGHADTVADSPATRLGRSGSFDGNGDRIDVSDDSILMPRDEISIEAWIKPDFDSWSDGIVVSRSGGYYLEVASNKRVRTYYYGTSGLPGWLYGPDLSTYGDNWLHLVATYDGLEKAIYVNGEKVAFAAAVGKTLAASTGTTIVGSVDGGRYFEGLIDQVGIYSYALTPEEILFRQSLGVPEPSSLLLFTLGLACCLPRRRRRR